MIWSACSNTPKSSGNPFALGPFHFPQIGLTRGVDALSGSISHDWGSTVCWEAVRTRSDVFSGVVSLALPVGHCL